MAAGTIHDAGGGGTSFFGAHHVTLGPDPTAANAAGPANAVADFSNMALQEFVALGNCSGQCLASRSEALRTNSCAPCVCHARKLDGRARRF